MCLGSHEDGGKMIKNFYPLGMDVEMGFKELWEMSGDCNRK